MQGVTQVHDQAGVHTLVEVATSEHLSEISGTMEIHTEHGHIIITGEDGQCKLTTTKIQNINVQTFNIFSISSACIGPRACDRPRARQYVPDCSGQSPG